ncbi:sigma-54-dependent Fis family transcriptional regulator, partial [Thauera sp. UPWRP]
IPLLAEHILARLAEREGGAPRRLSASALATLQGYPFPGNVRELENLLERACALCEGGEIEPADIDLQPADLTVPPAPERELAGSEFADESGADTEDERRRILKALDETRWNRSAAARNLGLTLRQLRYRLQKWGLE